MKNSSPEQAARLLHQVAQQQPLDQRDCKEERQTPAIPNLHVEGGEYDGGERVGGKRAQEPPILFQEQPPEPQFLPDTIREHENDEGWRQCEKARRGDSIVWKESFAQSVRRQDVEQQKDCNS